ncbi:MAG TPA: ATP synthase subunit I [Acetobacteraceae bacterium]|jgi:F1F0 ATPase subunit 2|nr:ATP synthase subunit I [Acetobacteraceae bacterium]
MTAAQAAMLCLWLVFGLTAGAGHFALLRWNAGLYLSGSGVLCALAVQMLRMAATGVLLAFAAVHGALALLTAAIGVLVARMLVLRMTAMP